MSWRQNHDEEKLCHSSHSAAIRRTQMFWHLHWLGSYICQQYTGATYSSCLFSPLADVSTSSGMHSSCPSFAHVTNVCLAVCKIRSSSFFFLSLALVFPSIFSLQRKKPHNRPETEDRQEPFASSCDSIRPVIIYCSLLHWWTNRKLFIQVGSRGKVEELRINIVFQAHTRPQFNYCQTQFAHQNKLCSFTMKVRPEQAVFVYKLPLTAGLSRPLLSSFFF